MLIFMAEFGVFGGTDEGGRGLLCNRLEINDDRPVPGGFPANHCFYFKHHRTIVVALETFLAD